MNVKKFEDLIAWQKARQLTEAIYRITSDGLFSRDFSLRDQIRRAAVSIMSNIAEVFERGSIKEFHQFIVIAKASCAELRSQLYVACDSGYIEMSVFEQIQSQALEVSKILGGLKASVLKKMNEQ
jgi:four helix bundle protein